MAKMAEDPRRRAERRRALELLDASCDGCTEAIMQARGVTIEMLVDLVRDGLATDCVTDAVLSSAKSRKWENVREA